MPDLTLDPAVLRPILEERVGHHSLAADDSWRCWCAHATPGDLAEYEKHRDRTAQLRLLLARLDEIAGKEGLLQCRACTTYLRALRELLDGDA